jgi:hypothetical protein
MLGEMEVKEEVGEAAVWLLAVGPGWLWGW